MLEKEIEDGLNLILENFTQKFIKKRSQSVTVAEAEKEALEEKILKLQELHDLLVLFCSFRIGGAHVDSKRFKKIFNDLRLIVHRDMFGAPEEFMITVTNYFNAVNNNEEQKAFEARRGLGQLDRSVKKKLTILRKGFSVGIQEILFSKPSNVQGEKNAKESEEIKKIIEYVSRVKVIADKADSLMKNIESKDVDRGEVYKSLRKLVLDNVTLFKEFNRLLKKYSPAILDIAQSAPLDNMPSALRMKYLEIRLTDLEIGTRNFSRQTPEACERTDDPEQLMDNFEVLKLIIRDYFVLAPKEFLPQNTSNASPKTAVEMGSTGFKTPASASVPASASTASQGSAVNFQGPKASNPSNTQDTKKAMEPPGTTAPADNATPPKKPSF